MIPLGNQVFHVVRAPLAVDARSGSQYRDWDNAVTTPVIWSLITPFELAEKLSFEDTKEREYARINMKVYAPPGTDVVHTDKIVYLGDVYEVLGHIGRWPTFDGQEHHVEFVIQRKEG